MNWTDRSTKHKVLALVGACRLAAYQRKRSHLFYEE